MDPFRILYAVFLYGVNIPKGHSLSTAELRRVGTILQPALVLRKIVGDTDNILLELSSPQTESSVRSTIECALNIRCVAIGVETLRIIVNRALQAIQRPDIRLIPPYRETITGAEWEFGVVLSSEPLPSTIETSQLLFEPTKNAVPLEIIAERALLARKRCKTESGSRIMFGSTLIKPWESILGKNGIHPNCLTSRSLNRLEEVVKQASSL